MVDAEVGVFQKSENTCIDLTTRTVFLYITMYIITCCCEDTQCPFLGAFCLFWFSVTHLCLLFELD